MAFDVSYHSRSSVRFSVQILLLSQIAAGWGETGSGRNATNQCPENAEVTMVHSPFTPYWKFERFAGDDQNCWVASDCLFENAGESRKQQFAATALVMGLIPFTIKDIAWPERRLVFVTKRLNWMVEILVLALGLVPVETENQTVTRKEANETTMLAANGWKMNEPTVKLTIFACSVAVALCYGCLATMEIYSKRSALGCVAPIFVVAWHLVALIPAAIHSLFARWRYPRRKQRDHQNQSFHAHNRTRPTPAAEYSNARGQTGSQSEVHAVTNETDSKADREKLFASAVQGSKEHWSVQMAWGVYYVAGTLVFTSIMAVTVEELVVWVVLGLATAACSKILAFFLCLASEETGGSQDGDGVMMNWMSRNSNRNPAAVHERPSTW